MPLSDLLPANAGFFLFVVNLGHSMKYILGAIAFTAGLVIAGQAMAETCTYHCYESGSVVQCKVTCR